MTNNQPSIYDDHGLLYVWFEVLPGNESSYKDSAEKIANNKPKTQGFGFSRLPVKGELLQVRDCLWSVEQVIHHDVSPEKISEMQIHQNRVFVATIQITFEDFT